MIVFRGILAIIIRLKPTGVKVPNPINPDEHAKILILEIHNNLEALIRAIEGKNDSKIKAAAIESLGMIGDKRAVPSLIPLLNGKEHETHIAAIEALGKIGDTRVVELLIKKLGDEYDFWVRTCAAEALGHIKDPRAVDSLILALDARDQTVGEYTSHSTSLRAAAAESLGLIGDTRAIKPLMQTFTGMKPELEKAVTKALRKINPPEYETLVAMLINNKGSWEDKLYAVKALGEMGDTRAVEPLIGILRADDDSLRGRAVEALGQIGDERAIPCLNDMLEDNDKYVRMDAATALGRFGDPRAASFLNEMLKDNDKYVRGNTAAALGNIKDAHAVEILIGALKDEDKYVRANAAAALGQVGDIRAIEPLIGTLKDKDLSVGATVALSLGRIGDERAVEPLLKSLNDQKEVELLLKLQKENVRRAAANGLKLIRQKNYLHWKEGDRCEYCGTTLKSLNLMDSLMKRRQCPIGNSYKP